MSTQLYDGEATGALLVPATTIVASTTFPGLALSPRFLPTASWVLDVTNAAAAGTYLFMLEVSNLVGGSYTEISRLTWPAATPGPQQVALGVSASLAGFAVNTALYARVRVTIGGATPSLSFTSWVGKPGGHVGLGTRPGNLYAAI